jgi:hypothetical protein
MCCSKIWLYWPSNYVISFLLLWPRGLWSWSAAARFLGLWFRIPQRACLSVCCECCLLPCRGICEGLITRPEVSHRMWCVAVCCLETSRMRRPWPALGRSATEKISNYVTNQLTITMEQILTTESNNPSRSQIRRTFYETEILFPSLKELFSLS